MKGNFERKAEEKKKEEEKKKIKDKFAQYSDKAFEIQMNNFCTLFF